MERNERGQWVSRFDPTPFYTASQLCFAHENEHGERRNKIDREICAESLKVQSEKADDFSKDEPKVKETLPKQEPSLDIDQNPSATSEEEMASKENC